MKKFLFLMLSLGLVSQLTADLTSKELNSPEAIAAHKERNDASRKEEDAKKAIKHQRREQLKAAGLGDTITPDVGSVMSCGTGNHNLKSMFLVPGFAISFCRSGNLDWTKVDRIALLKFLQQEIQKELDESEKAA